MPICARVTTTARLTQATTYLIQTGYGARRRLRRLRRGIASQFGRSARSPLHAPSAGVGRGESDTADHGEVMQLMGRTVPQPRGINATNVAAELVSTW